MSTGSESVAERRFMVVRNAEDQWSVWPADDPSPAGWIHTGFVGTEEECLSEVGRVWSDLRPASIRSASAGGNGNGNGGRDGDGDGDSASDRWWSAPTHPAGTVRDTSGAVGVTVPIPDVSISDLIDRCGAREPDGIAIRFAGRTITRAELTTRVRRLASRLLELGAGPERPVAVLLPRSADAVVAIVATLRAGSPYLPLSMADPVSRLAAVLRQAGDPPVLTDTEGRAMLSGSGYPGTVALLDDLDRASGGDAGDESSKAAFPQVGGGHLAYVMYTSGTSGPPKGVLGTHRQLVNYVRWCAEEFALEPGERALLHAPLYFVGSVMTLFTALTAGWELEVAPEPVAFDELRSLARGGRCGFLKLTPSHVRGLTAIGDVADLARLYMIGSEPLNLTPALAGWLAESPGSRFANHYGMSETCGATFYWVRGDEAAGERLPVGGPIINAEVHLVDPGGRRVPYGEVGELCLAGAVVGRGYHGDPELTARRWRPHPWGRPGERLLHTGDLARMTPDGTVEVLGRADRQVKIRGHRIALPAVEAAVLACPGVAEAVVSVMPDQQDVPRLTALLRPAPGAHPEAGLIRQRLLGELPEPWVPSRFIVTRDFPLTPNGKIDYARLAGVRGLRPETAGAFRDPATPVEKALCDIFAEVLELERVGADDNFRDLGGDSMNVVQVIALAQEAGIEVSIGEFLAHGTPGALAALATRSADADDIPTDVPTLQSRDDQWAPAGSDQSDQSDQIDDESTTAEDGTDGPTSPLAVPFAGAGRSAQLTWGQMHMWRPMQWYGAEFAGLNITRDIDLTDAPVDVRVCRSTIRRLVETYESVRTWFLQTADGPVQRVAATGVFPVQVLDVDPDEIDEAAREQSGRLLAEPFRHDQQWPVRICLVRCEGMVRRIVLVASHLAFDGWSLDRLTASLAGWIRGDTLDLPDPVQPVDQVARERSAAGRLRNAKALAHWQARLDELSPADTGPADTDLSDGRADRRADGRADPPWQRWALWSPGVATAATDLAARTRTSTSTVMLALAGITAAALQRRRTVGLLLIAGNRITRHERQIAGSTVQDALIVHTDRGRSLAEVIQETYRDATEAYANAQCDPVALDALRAESAARHGAPDLSWYFNDARSGREWEPAADTGGDHPGEPAGAEPFLVRGFKQQDMTFCLGLAQRGPHCEVFLLADTAVLAPERIRRFLAGLEPLLRAAVRDDLTTDDVVRTLLG